MGTDPIDLQVTGASSSTISTPTDAPVKKTGSQGISSDQGDIALSESVAALLVPTASIPPLPRPSETGSITGVDLLSMEKAYQEGYQKTVMTMLDEWNKSIQKENDRIREEINSPEYLAKKQDSAGVHSAAKDAEEQAIPLQSLTQVISNYLHAASNQDPNAISVLPIIQSASVAVGTTFIGEVVTQASFPEKADEMFGVGFNKLWESPGAAAWDARAELGLLGTLMMRGVVQQTIAMGVAGGAEAIKPKQFAQNYAASLIKLVVSGQLDQFAITMLLPKLRGEGAALTPERAAHVIATFKIFMLSSALAALYKADTGKITGREFLDYLDGKIPVGPGNKQALWTKGTVMSLIRHNLNALPVEEQARVRVLLSAYMDTDPPIEGLGKAQQMFGGLSTSGASPLKG